MPERQMGRMTIVQENVGPEWCWMNPPEGMERLPMWVKGSHRITLFLASGWTLDTQREPERCRLHASRIPAPALAPKKSNKKKAKA